VSAGAILRSMGAVRTWQRTRQCWLGRMNRSASDAALNLPVSAWPRASHRALPALSGLPPLVGNPLLSQICEWPRTCPPPLAGGVP